MATRSSPTSSPASPSRDAVTVQRDRAAAIARAIGEAGPNDIVLIAGKGHEPYQEIARRAVTPSTTPQVARAVLEARGMKPLPLSQIARMDRRPPARRRRRWSTTIATDTRALAAATAAALFVALKGERFDGHDHVAAAAGRQARARVLVSRAARHRPLPQVVVADTERALAALRRPRMQRERGSQGDRASPAATARPASRR